MRGVIYFILGLVIGAALTTYLGGSIPSIFQ